MRSLALSGRSSEWSIAFSDWRWSIALSDRLSGLALRGRSSERSTPLIAGTQQSLSGPCRSAVSECFSPVSASCQSAVSAARHRGVPLTSHQAMWVGGWVVGSGWGVRVGWGGGWGLGGYRPERMGVSVLASAGFFVPKDLGVFSMCVPSPVPFSYRGASGSFLCACTLPSPPGPRPCACSPHYFPLLHSFSAPGGPMCVLSMYFYLNVADGEGGCQPNPKPKILSLIGRG